MWKRGRWLCFHNLHKEEKWKYANHSKSGKLKWTHVTYHHFKMEYLADVVETVHPNC